MLIALPVAPQVFFIKCVPRERGSERGSERLVCVCKRFFFLLLEPGSPQEKFSVIPNLGVSNLLFSELGP